MSASIITPRNDLTAEKVREMLDFDPVVGIFKWKNKTNRRDLNGRIAGHLDAHGYLTMQIGKRHYYAHRLAWLWVNGSWPEGDIDHINGNRADIRICNLRDATRTINAQNQRRARGKSVSGLLGAHRHPSTGRWLARIVVAGRLIRLGDFATPEQAHECYIEAKRRLHAGCTI